MGDYIRKFDIPDYSTSKVYNKYEVVKVSNGADGEYYFVAAKGDNQNQLDTVSFTSTSFWKRFDDYNNDFASVWVPDYSSAVDTEPKAINSQLDQGVTTLSREGINTVPLKFNLTFNNISDIEAKSLLCFFDFLGTCRSFNWTPPPPYEKLLSFNYTNLRHTYTRKNINDVSVSLEQSFVIFGVGAGQQKFGAF